jgi:hypothetical protein
MLTGDSFVRNCWQCHPGPEGRLKTVVKEHWFSSLKAVLLKRWLQVSSTWDAACTATLARFHSPGRTICIHSLDAGRAACIAHTAR